MALAGAAGNLALSHRDGSVPPDDSNCQATLVRHFSVNQRLARGTDTFFIQFIPIPLKPHLVPVSVTTELMTTEKLSHSSETLAPPFPTLLDCAASSFVTT